MTKVSNCSVMCPFTHSPCTDCAIYRGRHHYLMFSNSSSGPDQTRELIDTYFKGMERGSDPWSDNGNGCPGNLNSEILMKLIDSKG
jgi:hypothetical protein